MGNLQSYVLNRFSSSITLLQEASMADWESGLTNFLSSTHSDEALDSHIREIILDFMQRSGLSISFVPIHVPVDIEDKMYALAEAYGLSLNTGLLRKCATVGLETATFAYRHTPPDVQVVIALYTAVCAVIDTDEILSAQVMSTFPRCLAEGLPQVHPILSAFAKLLTNMHEHFAPYSAAIITTSTVDFVSSEMLVRDEAQGGRPDTYDKAAGYAEWIRLKNGVAEAFAAFVWPRKMFPQIKTYVQTLPHIGQWACYANDLCSFYKEVKDNEKDNYVSQLAAINGQSPIQAVQHLADKVVAIDLRIKDILGDSPERKTWESFATAYTEFHIHSARYRLREILSEYYQEA